MSWLVSTALVGDPIMSPTITSHIGAGDGQGHQVAAGGFKVLVTVTSHQRTLSTETAKGGTPTLLVDTV